jgi:hypothetical protein
LDVGTLFMLGLDTISLIICRLHWYIDYPGNSRVPEITYLTSIHNYAAYYKKLDHLKEKNMISEMREKKNDQAEKLVSRFTKKLKNIDKET